MKQFFAGGSIGEKSLASTWIERTIGEESLQELYGNDVREHYDNRHFSNCINSQSKVLNFLKAKFAILS